MIKMERYNSFTVEIPVQFRLKSIKLSTVEIPVQFRLKSIKLFTVEIPVQSRLKSIKLLHSWDPGSIPVKSNSLNWNPSSNPPSLNLLQLNNRYDPGGMRTSTIIPGQSWLVKISCLSLLYKKKRSKFPYPAGPLCLGGFLPPPSLFLD